MNRVEHRTTARRRKGAYHAMLLAGAAGLAAPVPGWAQSGESSAAAAAQDAASGQPGRHRFEIPAGEATTALQDYAKQSGKQVLFDYDAVKGRATAAVSGEMTDATALQRLLRGSGLKVTSADGTTVTVGPERARATPGESLAARGGRNRGSSWGDDTVPAGLAGISEILVVGSRSQNVDIRRSEDDPQPYVVFDKEEIEASNATSLEDFFRSRLPMNTQQEPINQRSSMDESSVYGNISEINLRGLGANQTLILVDGRRAPRVVRSGSAGFDFSQADINGIPLSAIERVEVL